MLIVLRCEEALARRLGARRANPSEGPVPYHAPAEHIAIIGSDGVYETVWYWPLDDEWRNAKIG
jgi:hypothetical protein